jgi:glyceraldehyde 3-phosphate dehydrogenase
MINIAISGYGRIGRNILRAFYERPSLADKIRILAINDLGSPEINAHLPLGEPWPKVRRLRDVQ